MSRYASQGSGGNAVAASMLNNIAGKENSYKEGIKHNHAMCKQAAERIVSLEKTLPDLIGEIMPKEELEKLLQGYKDDVKEIAAGNVERERTVNSFIAAVKQVQQGIAAAPTQNEDELPDYQTSITQAMDTIKANTAEMQVEVRQEALYLQVAEALGEATAAATGDDDIEVVPDNTHQNKQTCKCPITGLYMDDAVKNKVCSHTYSKAGILNHIRTKGYHAACPVGACGNQRVTESQLEEDTEMIMRVRREKRRQDREKEQIASQASLIDTDEED